jgi:hypothetical protein
MSWTKLQLINSAFEEIGLAPYVFDLTAEQLQYGLRRLDAMMAEWNGRGIRIGYPMAADPTASDIDDDSGVPDYAIQAIIQNLAILIAPSFGRPVQRETKVSAKTALNTLASKTSFPASRQYPSTMPVGAGNKPGFDEQYFSGTDNSISTGTDGELEFT